MCLCVCIYPTLEFGLGALGCLDFVPCVLPSFRNMPQFSLKVLYVLHTHTHTQSIHISTSVQH